MGNFLAFFQSKQDRFPADSGVDAMRKTTIVLALIASPILVSSPLRADVSGEIARIEKLPRTRRLAEYETLADRKALSDADRTAVIKAFANHATKVSPVYGTSTHKIDPARWQKMLEYAFKQDPTDKEVLFALCQLLIDTKKHAEARPYAQAFLKAHEEDHFAKAFSQYCQAKAGAAAGPRVLTFPLHFCVITKNPQAQERATQAQCREEVEIFNRSFVTLEKKPLVKFVFKGFSSYAEVRNSPCELLQLGDSTKPHSSEAATRAFNTCEVSKIRDKGAINVYIFDSHSEKAGFGDQTSHGIRNSNRPFVLIDWQRLGSNLQNAEPHEMGHAFGLGHVGIPGATGQTSTNIMASVSEDFGSGGQRDLGFSESQAAAILYHAQRTYSRLGLK
jgi:hypothetical protein